MIAPPSVTEISEPRKLVPKNRRRITAKARSSSAITATATSTADRYWGMRNGSVCRMPPRNVPAPVIAPRRYGRPRPVRSPVSESPSEKAMLTPAPTAVASPARNA